MRSTPSPTSASASRSRTAIRTCRRRRCSAPGYRLPLAALRRRRRAARPVRLRRVGAHRRAGRAPPGPPPLRLRAARRRGRARVRARARLRVGGLRRTSARRRSSTRRSSSRRSGALVPAALRALAKGGTVVCAGIHMSDIPSFPYELLWEERARPLRREPHAPRRRGVPRARAAGAGADGDRDLRARGRERGARPAAPRRDSRRGRAAAIGSARDEAALRAVLRLPAPVPGRRAHARRRAGALRLEHLGAVQPLVRGAWTAAGPSS